MLVHTSELSSSVPVAAVGHCLRVGGELTIASVAYLDEFGDEANFPTVGNTMSVVCSDIGTDETPRLCIYTPCYVMANSNLTYNFTVAQRAYAIQQGDTARAGWYKAAEPYFPPSTATDNYFVFRKPCE